ncbi:MAG: VOC family protein [Gammaproteobacteria bacterium]|nr:VOC family protein [Gammaproteobacteria bacterium]
MSEQAKSKSKSGLRTLAGALPRRLHHAAWVTRDQEATRHFYEDIIGLPLTATWAERNPRTGVEYCHTFFEIGDGGALAFFQYADQEDNPVELKSPGHIAFECDAGTQGGIKRRLEEAGYETRLTDHGYCLSLYVNDPNNLRLEFTVDHAGLEDVMQQRRDDAHETLARWLAGDHTPNNHIRRG